MKYASLLILNLGILTFSPFASAENPAVPEHATESAAKNLKAFPEAKDGMERHIIYLPKLAKESDHKVELVAGKEVITDGVNRYFGGTGIEAKPLRGWGFTFYNVVDKGPVAQTLMGTIGPAKKVKEFVVGQTLMVRYNSRLPIVIYVKKGHQIKYRIWAAKEVADVPKG